MNPIQQLVQRLGNAGAVSNAAAELEARRAEEALIDELPGRVLVRRDTPTSDAA